MKVLALIPARKGSKRLPGKNVRRLGGKPLIKWTIDVAKQTKGFCDILVSTDGDEIAAVARDAGVMVPWLRPAELASDYATSADVAIHALDWYESYRGVVDALVLLQPTSPFRTVETITSGIKAFEKFSRRPVLTVSCHDSDTAASRIARGNSIYKNRKEGLEILNKKETLKYCTPNGVLYVISPQDLRSEKSFITGEIVPLFVYSDSESIDIDTLDDWKMAEEVIKANQV